jgi:hypothetical protein
MHAPARSQTVPPSISVTGAPSKSVLTLRRSLQSPATKADSAVFEVASVKLDSQKGPVDVLVIDRAEQPTED